MAIITPKPLNEASRHTLGQTVPLGNKRVWAGKNKEFLKEIYL